MIEVTHEDVLGQPDGTFGAHRGAGIKHWSHRKFEKIYQVTITIEKIVKNGHH